MLPDTHANKAIYPAALIVVAAAVHALFTGEVNRTELEPALTALLMAGLVYVVRNRPTRAGLHFHEGEPAEGATTTLGTPVDQLEALGLLEEPLHVKQDRELAEGRASRVRRKPTRRA